MNKSQMVLAAIGGTVVVGALVLGYFIWDASSVKAENASALEDSLAAASGVMKKLPIPPQAKELEVFKAGCKAYDEWRADAEKLAARGDLVFEKVSPAELKTAIVGEARKLADRPGYFQGKLVHADFHFGFKDYITGGALPPDDAAELKRLQREWNDVATVLKTIAECGGADVAIADVKMGKAKAVAVEEEQPQAKKRKARKSSKKAKTPEEDEAAEQGPAVTSFTVDFLCRPSALVKALNAFATGTRFVVIDNCSFSRERDEIAEKLGGDAKKSEQAGSSRRRRRGAAQQAEQQEKSEDAKSGVVTDPSVAPLLKVSMAVSVYDFGSLEKEQTDASEDEKKSEEEK